MAYSTRQLIIDAYYVSGVVGPDYEFTSGNDIDYGLSVLNDFITIKGADINHIPYYTVLDGNFVIGQEIYFFENLVEVESMTFFLRNPAQTSQSSIRFEMREQTREEYFAYPRAEHINTLPLSWHLERVTNGSNIYVYFLPNEPYRFQLVGKFALNRTSLNQDLTTVYDEWYRQYLKYGLAIWLCNFRTVTPSQELVKIFNEMSQKMIDLSPKDFTLRKQSYFSRSIGGVTWGDVNYSKMWRGST